MHISNPLRAVSLGVALALAVPGLAVAGNELEHSDKNKAATAQNAGMHSDTMAEKSQSTSQAMHRRQLQDRPGQSATDARREAVIWTSFTLNSTLKATDVDVQVSNGKATLTGTVESQVERELAEDIAESVTGISQVTNRIQIDPNVQPYVDIKIDRSGTDYTAARDGGTDRDFGTALFDATTTAQVKSKLLWNTNTDGLDINVDTLYGHVTLHGTADTAASKQLAERLARDTNGVVAVDNRLVIGSDSTAMTTGDSTTMMRGDKQGAVQPADADRTSTVVNADFDDNADVDAQARVDADADIDMDMDRPDGWVTTKVKSTLLFSRAVDGFDINVDTREGVVRLDGTVTSNREKQQAVQLAREVVGVRSVDASALRIVSDEAVVRSDED